VNTDEKIRDELYREHLELKRLLIERNKQVALMTIELTAQKSRLAFVNC